MLIVKENGVSKTEVEVPTLLIDYGGVLTSSHLRLSAPTYARVSECSQDVNA